MIIKKNALKQLTAFVKPCTTTFRKKKSKGRFKNKKIFRRICKKVKNNSRRTADDYKRA